MSRAKLSLTPEAVAAVLTAAGFGAAQMDEDNYRPVTEGFTAYHVPVTHEDRVGVSWHSGYGSYSEDWVHEPEPHLAGCASTLEAAGYQVEFVADFPVGGLIVWVDGEF